MIYNGLTPGTNYGSDGLEGSGRGYYVNPLAVNETLIDAGTMGSAEYGLGGAQSNALYRDGGNRVSGTLFGAYTGSGMQWDNLSQELFDQGLQNVNTHPEDLRRQHHAGRAGPEESGVLLRPLTCVGRDRDARPICIVMRMWRPACREHRSPCGATRPTSASRSISGSSTRRSASAWRRS